MIGGDFRFTYADLKSPSDHGQKLSWHFSPAVLPSVNSGLVLSSQFEVFSFRSSLDFEISFTLAVVRRIWEFHILKEKAHFVKWGLFLSLSALWRWNHEQYSLSWNLCRSCLLQTPQVVLLRRLVRKRTFYFEKKENAFFFQGMKKFSSEGKIFW